MVYTWIYTNYTIYSFLIFLDEGFYVVEVNYYRRWSPWGRMVCSIPFWCNLGRNLTLLETHSTQAMHPASSHSMVTMEREGKFWTIRLSISYHTLSWSSLFMSYVKWTSESKGEDMVWSCWYSPEISSPIISYCSFLMLLYPCKETRINA